MKIQIEGWGVADLLNKAAEANKQGSPSSAQM
jgi:hypothetical protein